MLQLHSQNFYLCFLLGETKGNVLGKKLPLPDLKCALKRNNYLASYSRLQFSLVLTTCSYIWLTGLFVRYVYIVSVVSSIVSFSNHRPRLASYRVTTSGTLQGDHVWEATGSLLKKELTFAFFNSSNSFHIFAHFFLKCFFFGPRSFWQS